MTQNTLETGAIPVVPISKAAFKKARASLEHQKENRERLKRTYPDSRYIGDDYAYICLLIEDGSPRIEFKYTNKPPKRDGAKRSQLVMPTRLGQSMTETRWNRRPIALRWTA